MTAGREDDGPEGWRRGVAPPEQLGAWWVPNRSGAHEAVVRMGTGVAGRVIEMVAAGRPDV